MSRRKEKFATQRRALMQIEVKAAAAAWTVMNEPELHMEKHQTQSRIPSVLHPKALSYSKVQFMMKCCSCCRSPGTALKLESLKTTAGISFFNFSVCFPAVWWFPKPEGTRASLKWWRHPATLCCTSSATPPTTSLASTSSTRTSNPSLKPSLVILDQCQNWKGCSLLLGKPCSPDGRLE